MYISFISNYFIFNKLDHINIKNLVISSYFIYKIMNFFYIFMIDFEFRLLYILQVGSQIASPVLPTPEMVKSKSVRTDVESGN